MLWKSLQQTVTKNAEQSKEGHSIGCHKLYNVYFVSYSSKEYTILHIWKKYSVPWLSWLPVLTLTDKDAHSHWFQLDQQ